MVTPQAQPLSLEDQCLLHLIYHLEEYTPETLASLPLHLRRRLLLNLPAADVCQLEDTPVTSGIDIDNNVWKELLAFGRPETWTYPSTPSAKERVFHDMYCSFLNGNIDLASQFLFSLRGHLALRDWTNLQHSFPPKPASLYTFPTPSRYARCSSRDTLMTQLLSVIVHKCKYWAESIWLDCSAFGNSELWRRRGVLSSSLLGEVFARTKSLTFHVASFNAESWSVPQFVLELVFARPNVSLRSLAFHGPPRFVCNAVAASCLFLSASPCTPDQIMCQSLYSRSLSYSIPYDGLTAITVGGLVGIGTIEEGQLYNQLESIVQHQTSLESFTLTCSSTPSLALSFYNKLGFLFLKPQFKLLRLDSARIDWKCLIVLLLPFLLSPVSEGLTQELCFCDVTLCLGIPAPGIAKKVLEKCGDYIRSASGKALLFHNVLFSGLQDTIPFFDLLSTYRCPELLSSFEMTFRQHWCRDYPLGEDKVVNLFLEQPITQLESLVIGDAPLSSQSMCMCNPISFFTKLVTAPRLRVLSLCNCEIGKGNLLRAFSHGLLRQSAVSQLEELNIDNNELGCAKDDHFQGFCEAVCKLHQREKLTLSLRYNDLKLKHFVWLHRASRECSSRMCSSSECSSRTQFRVLNVRDNDYQACVLLDIASSGDFLDT